ncbi:MAG: flagellar hook-associated family protein [Pseudaminobacter sp.]|nr:flagellar hook-associated family protein [Pseudaminobacter sp.]
MKTSFVSSAAISQAMRYSLLRTQSNLVQAQKESSTGMVADTGLALGARAAHSVSFARDLNRLNSIVDSNALVASRLSATQTALNQITSAAQTFLATLTTASSSEALTDVAQASGKATLDALTSLLNSSFNGEQLFAGTNTDVRPIDDFSSAGSQAKAAFDLSFLGHFGFAQSDPAAVSITAADMDIFLTNVVEPQFLGGGWQANWSNATDQRIVSRIALNETAETSVSANNDGVRKLAMAAATISDLLASEVGAPARTALMTRAVSLVGEAISDLGNLQAQTGIVEKRVTDASQRVKLQADLFERHILDLEGVDPYEAATRVADLLSHIETSYALTARIQQLSFLRFMS